MLGGAWVPTFVFPAWLQQFTRIVPVRWAVDGFDAMTWRGVGLKVALPPLGVCRRSPRPSVRGGLTFRWEEA